ncbi:Glycine--tRNA ligase 1, mitochondrial [Coemansia javaensis]|uniref:glycine--tRNA ligase n=1 Tax=Coemansia javaensis TaxID=2761396 RepID=A0A9W8H5E0_9FUNG|nr:Glycine--tRNA ligase 1, mitochondrial [Coemansia javaensis]
MANGELNVDRSALDQLLQKRFFIAPSFEIYGGIKGLYDFGPTGTALQQNLIGLWRQHFVIEEDMLEIDCSIITPSRVLETSGHVEKFADWMCRDTVSNDFLRADHLVEEVLEARLEGDALARGMAEVSIQADAAAKQAGAKKSKKKGGAAAPVRLDDEAADRFRGILAQIDNYDGAALGELIVKYDIRNPATGNAVTAPMPFNLMFGTSIGPTGALKGFLRPETAQGQFMNFSRLLEFNNQKMPFASAMIGRSFRNEISPRQGILRVREFTMAEVEHFVDPLNKAHPRFDEVAGLTLPLLPAARQLEEKTDPVFMTVGDAVGQGIVNNQTLGYFLGRIYLYLMKIGIRGDLLRFRQHMGNEMAHYACDCWDAEIKTTDGWIECVGCADRSAYDLTKHSEATNKKLVVQENLPEPLVYEKLVCVPNSKVFGPRLRRAAAAVERHLAALPEAELAALRDALVRDGRATVTLAGTAADGAHEITADMVAIEKQTITEHVRVYTPNVIEPSFGIGRILHALIEHSYSVRAGDGQRAVLGFNPLVAPFKCLVLPLSGNASFAKPLREVARRLRAAGVPARVDDTASASIGRRYARNDEIGTPFAITVDFQTAEDNTVTLRERDTTNQIRGPLQEMVEVVKSLVDGASTWSDVLGRYPLIDAVASDTEA